MAADPGSAALGPADQGCHPQPSPKRRAPVTIPRLEIGTERGNTLPVPRAASAGPPVRGGGSWETEREEGSQRSHPGFVAGHHQVCILVQNVDLKG